MTDRSTAPRVIFLGGLGRSGTTLLERLLGQLPEVAPLGEVVHLWERGVLADEPCGCGRPFTACPFWRDVGERAFGGWTSMLAERVLALRHRVDRTRRLARIAHEDLPEYVRAYRRIYQAAAEAAQARTVVDSSKHASLAYCLLEAGPQRVIGLPSSGRATVLHQEWATARGSRTTCTTWTSTPASSRQ